MKKLEVGYHYRHQRAVNIVRWSPDGHLLASGDDESIIIIWKVMNFCYWSRNPSPFLYVIVQMKEGKGSGGNLFDDGAETNSENWTVYQMIRHQSYSPYLFACCRFKKYVEIRLNPGLTLTIFTTWPGHPVATTFSLGGRNSNSERWKI